MRSTPVRTLVLTAAALVLGLGSPSMADSWAPPKTEQETSKNGLYRLTVVPSMERASKDASGKVVERRALGKLEKKGADNSFKAVWEQPLTNDEAPVRVLVADDGTIVTLDNWHRMGYGSNVVAIYAPDGKLVRSMGLDGFLSPEEIGRLPTSVSSIWWGIGHQFDGHQQAVLLNVGNDRMFGDGDGLPRKIVRVDLRTGGVITFSRDQPGKNEAKPAAPKAP